ncbi:MAG: hypothetical protein KJ905_01470 [Nanoarchaeota archaeon]|nr:hypothetical protein [Nanoarchaeota archaeon]MBU1501429.1 hypothetical protein [Nanoarchaeota archaeon]MBU2458868.1 hypothetical protein [Nanoarchaeota archaeon]
MPKKRKPNYNIVFNSLVALGFLALAFIRSNWLYIIPSVILMIINQRELMKPRI